MEADKGTEEPHVTTEDAEEHPSSKDPSAKDSQEPPIPEIPLEPLASKSHIVPSTSQIPLETHTSETPLEPPIPGTPLAHSASEVPLETPISKVPEKDLTFHTSSRSPVPGSSSNDLKKDLLSHSPSSEDTSESEGLQKHPLSGPPAQVHLDTSAKEREEEEESKKGVNATDRTTHKAQHEHQQGKKKRKKGVIRYAVHPVVPAQQAELGEAVKAVHREKCGAQVNYLFQWEKDAALNAIQTGLYIGWRCPHYLWDCFRIGEESKCFCGHLLREHQIISDISVPCSVGQCRCLVFCFIPSRPEEVGEFWLKRRATFDPRAWRAQCRCKHSHEDHAANGSHSCRVRGCCCSCFESNFLCAACDRRWEEHETFFETEETRRRGRRPHGADHTPFAEMSTLREAISNNSDSEAPQKQAPSDHPHSYPSPPGLPPTVRPGPMSGPRT